LFVRKAKVFIPEGTVSTEGVALSAPPGAPQGSFASAAATEDLVLSAPLGAPERKAFETDPKTKDGALNTLHYLNLRFIGVGFRGYIIKKSCECS